MRKLPVIAAFSHAIRSTLNNFGFAFYISWPWLLILAPLNILISLADIGGSEGRTMANPAAGFFGLILGIISLLANSSVAVNWHRYILLDEIPMGMQRLRLSATVWRYLGNIFLVFLIIGLVFVAGAVFVGVAIAITGIKQSLAVSYVVLLLTPFIAYLFVASYRLMVKLPAIALDRMDFTFASAWEATRGNFWQILGLLLLYGLAAGGIFLAFILLVYFLIFLGPLGLVMVLAFQIMLNWIFVIFGVTMLTSLYGFFVEQRDF